MSDRDSFSEYDEPYSDERDATIAARRGVEAYICPDCRNTFQQPFKCVTCGAQKLYDSTLLDAQKRAERAEAALAAVKAAQPEPMSDERITALWVKTQMDCISPPIFLAFARALIREVQPDGWVSVPKEPTEEMLDAICSVRFRQGAEMYREIYKTMLAAAPKEAR